MRNIDYSNTIFYKIYCKNLEISDIYIGHTTNFVTRQHGHKQSCTNERNIGYNTKVYQFIREHGGWDNWKMEIVGYKCCKNMREACEEEQRYYNEYNATLNSVLPIRQIENSSYEKSEVIQVLPDTNKTYKFICQGCNYKCNNKKDYNKHLLTDKHQRLINGDTNNNINRTYACKCGKNYKHAPSLSKHKKHCVIIKSPISHVSHCSTNSLESSASDLVTKIQQEIKENKESLIQRQNFIQKRCAYLKEQQEQYSKQIQQMLDNIMLNS